MRDLDIDLIATARGIASVQLADGSIPWAPRRHVDPWNHVEAAMGLDVAGFHREAARAYEWLAATQRQDGAWPAATLDGRVIDGTIDANFCIYVAAGTWHHFLATSDERFLRDMWPVVELAVESVLDLQMVSGAIAWARDRSYRPWLQALLTSSSSIHHSLRCAITIAEWIGEQRPDWELSLDRLARAIADEGDDFIPKPRFAMDWYYPILGGAVAGDAALSRLMERWDAFVIDRKGVLCTADRPWVTAGETAELIIACTSLGLVDDAARLFDWVQHLRDDDGWYWTGANHPDGSIYPHEKTTWSAGAMLLAADVLGGASDTSGLFHPAEACPALDAPGA